MPYVCKRHIAEVDIADLDDDSSRIVARNLGLCIGSRACGNKCPKHAGHKGGREKQATVHSDRNPRKDECGTILQVPKCFKGYIGDRGDLAGA